MSNEIQRQIAKPTINLLFEEKLSEIIPVEQLNVILSTPPPDVWIKTHPFIKDHKYLPIDKVEYLLRSCFKKFQIEVKEIKQLFNAIQCTVRVHYLNPATNDMMFHDGVGAWDLQTQSKSGPLKMDISNINIGAVTMATGIAKTIAIKDACDHFGSLFGANLNRKDVINFAGNAELLSMGVGESDLVELFVLKKDELSNDELIDANRIINNREIASYTKLSKLLKSK
jgi:hypothetical protein